MTVSVQPGRNGGQLRKGNPGNRGGPGYPPSVLRERLRGTMDARVEMLEQIMDGECVAKGRVEVSRLAPHVECAKCGPDSKIRPRDGLGDIQISWMVSASPKERIQAFDVAAKYGLGALKEISVENVRERLGKTLDVIRHALPPEQAAELINQLRGVWA